MRPEEKMDWKYLLTSFEGRISRQPFWLSILALIIVQWIVMIILSMVLGISMMGGMDPNMNPEAAASAEMTGMMPLIIISLIFVYPALAIYAKRWHDRGKSGWWTLIGLVPVIGGIWLLVELGFLRGTEGPNQYGNDPLA
jgi:uncharacterized membrane protein YhaH (DUF805 family)